MDHLELTKKYTYDGLINKEVWICDYRLNEYRGDRPIRIVTPKLVKIISNEELPKNKRVYYSDFHFREIKNGKLLPTIISPYDNTGYRMYSGVSLNIFDDEKECKEHFVKQCKEAISEYIEYLEENKRLIENRMLDIEKLIDKYEYIVE